MTKGEAPPGASEARVVLDETARAVRLMKASWLRVAMNLKRIRDQGLWRFSKTPVKSFDEYVYGVLQINRTVARRMLEAMGYTEERRPEVLRDFLAGKEDVHVPSYDVLDQLRRARRAFDGREDDLEELESRVFDDGIGRVHLKREIDERLGRGEEAREGKERAGRDEEPAKPSDLEGLIEELKGIESRLLKLQVSADARRLAFRLVETLEKERRQAASEKEAAGS